eukprot:364902-Chlamydomonas_euryale.AAC.24
MLPETPSLVPLSATVQPVAELPAAMQLAVAPLVAPPSAALQGTAGCCEASPGSFARPASTVYAHPVRKCDSASRSTNTSRGASRCGSCCGARAIIIMSAAAACAAAAATGALPASSHAPATIRRASWRGMALPRWSHANSHVRRSAP